MKRIKKKNTYKKENTNFTSCFLSVKAKKGVTLTSLVIYMTVMFVILAIIMRVMTNFRNNMDEVSDVTFESEFEKLNLYMLEETNIKGNGVRAFSQNSITFEDENRFEFRKEAQNEVGEIYFNDIKLCKNVNSCTFLIQTNEYDKLIIEMTIEINNVSKEVIYSFNNNETNSPIISEGDYIINRIDEED